MCSTALRWRSTIGIHDEFLCYGVLGIAPKRRQKFASRALLGEGGERTEHITAREGGGGGRGGG